MGRVINESIKISIVIYSGMVIGAVNVLWLSAQYLTTEEIGIVKFINEAGFLSAMFATFGTSSIVDRFFPYWKNDQAKHQGFLVYVIAHALTGFLLFTVCFFLFNDVFNLIYGKGSPELIKYYQLLLPLTLFIVLQVVTEAYIRAHFKTFFATIVREIFLKVSNSALILLYAFNIITFDQFMMYLMLSFGLAVLLLFLYIKKIERFYLVMPKRDIRTYKEMSIYGFFVIMASLGSVMVSRLDVLMLPAMNGIGATGIYTIALMICIAIEVPKKSVFQITTPLLTEALKNNNKPIIKELYQKSSINLFTIGLLLFLGIWCSIDEIFQIMPNSDIYKQGKYVVFWIGIAKLIDLVSGINSEIIYLSRYYKFFMLISVLLAITTVLLNRIFIPQYQILGAAIAMVLAISTFSVAKSLFVFIKFKIQPFGIKTALALLIAVLTWGIIQLLPTFSNPFISAAIKSVVITIVFSLLCYSLKVSPEINQVINSVYQRIEKLIKK
jgi:O-antigen/teichoic acid export membrane protein